MDSARGTPLMTTGNYPEVNDVSYSSNPPQNYERYQPNTYQNQNYGNQPIQGYPQNDSNQYQNQGYQQNQKYPIQAYPQNQGFQPQGPMGPPPPPQMQPNVVINFPAGITTAHRTFYLIKQVMD